MFFSSVSSTFNGEDISEQSVRAATRGATRQAISASDQDTQHPQMSSYGSTEETGSDQKESSSPGVSFNKREISTLRSEDFCEINAQEEEMRKDFASKCNESQKFLQELHHNFLSFTQYQFVFMDKEGRNINLSRADVIRLHHQHLETINVVHRMAQELNKTQERNAELLSEKDGWDAQKNSATEAGEEIKKVNESLKKENEMLKMEIKENEDANRLKQALKNMGEIASKLVTDKSALHKERVGLKSLNEKMLREKEFQSKLILQKSNEIADITDAYEKNKKELKDLREFKRKIFHLQEEMVLDAVKCEKEKWLDIQEEWSSDKKFLEEKLEEEQKRSERLNSALGKSRKQVKKFLQKCKDLNLQVQEANHQLCHAKLQLMALGVKVIKGEGGSQALSSVSAVKTRSAYEDVVVVEIDSD